MKRSRERGVSFTYNRNNKVLHCGLIDKEEFERIGKSANPLAPVYTDVIDNVYIKNERLTNLDGLSVADLCEYILSHNIF